MTEPETSVLLVDDNKSYRQAFRRHLTLRGYKVAEAEDSLEALELAQGGDHDVVVTDLAMRHATEGLDLIRQVRAARPDLPIIMISAVGTFDEGAEAVRLGAFQVISKSKIDEEMGNLCRAIDAAAEQRRRARAALDEIASALREAETDRAKGLALLGEILKRPDTPAAAKGEAFDRMIELNAEAGAAELAALSGRGDLAETAAREAIEKVDDALRGLIPQYEALDNDTRQTLRTAEFLYQQGAGAGPAVDFSRSMGFTYCFAVENEAKVRLRKRLQKFFGDPQTPALVQSLFETNGRSVSIFYQQHLHRAQQGMENEATIENFYHTFQRVLEHRGRYKPDGLKALGIVLICFGRSYTFRKLNKDVKIENPLGLKGLESEADVVRLASLLINLQHYRNPYIHPEISEMTKLSHIRETALSCLNMIAQLQ